MALVDGRRSLAEVVKLSAMAQEDALLQLAHLKLAGIITRTERKAEQDSPQLEKMVNRLAGLFEEYLTEKKIDVAPNRRLSKTFLENPIEQK